MLGLGVDGLVLEVGPGLLPSCPGGDSEGVGEGVGMMN